MHIDPGAATVIVGFFILCGQILSYLQGVRIHSAVNSNFQEQRQANMVLQAKLDGMRDTAVAVARVQRDVTAAASQLAHADSQIAVTTASERQDRRVDDVTGTIAP